MVRGGAPADFGRVGELESLQDAYDSRTAEMAIIYGRRRIGKTALIQKFCEGKPAFFYTAKAWKDPYQLDRFSQAVGTFCGNPQLRYLEWTSALRALATQPSPSRKVIVIDEFQMMFGDDNQTGQKIADMLEKSVRLFRAAGIHFILASQTLIGNMALAHNKDSIFSQIPIRIALKNSESEARAVLSMNNAAAAFVRPREAVVNLDYGELSQNRKTVIAFADEAVLRPIRRKMWEEARGYTVPPYVFESERRVTIANGIETIQQLRETARVPVAMIGNKISIDGERITLPMLHEPGRNMAILGAPDGDCNQAVGILQSAAASLAAQHPKGDARFMFCDFEGDEQPYERRYPQFASMMENLGFFIEDISREQFSETIQELMTQPTGEDTIYIFGSTMDRWEFEPDPFGQASPLKDFVEKGPARRIHFIGWWVKASKFTAQTAGFGNSDAFNSKIFLRIDERTIQSLTSPFIRWSAQANRGLIIDDVEFSEEIPFIPYAPVTQSDANAFRDQQWS